MMKQFERRIKRIENIILFSTFESLHYGRVFENLRCLCLYNIIGIHLSIFLNIKQRVPVLQNRHDGIIAIQAFNDLLYRLNTYQRSDGIMDNNIGFCAINSFQADFPCLLRRSATFHYRNPRIYR